MPAQMTSLLFHSGHAQPNFANAQNYIDKPNYRTPHLVATETHLQQDRSKEKIEKVMEDFQGLYEKERRHQTDIKYNGQLSHEDYLNGIQKKKKDQHKDMRTHLKIQEEKKVQDEQRLVQMDREYGQKVDQELTRNQAMATIYPPIQTIPSDQALSLKRQKQLEYNRQLEAQVKAKQDKSLQEHLQLREESRKNQQEYMDKVQ